MSLIFNQKAIALIRSNAVFSELLDKDLEAIFRIVERKKYPKDRQVFSLDQKASYFFLVESGAFILNLPGKRYKTFKAGDLFGEIAIINNNVRTGSIRALEESTLLAFNGDKLYDSEFVPVEVALKITRALAKKVTTYLRTREQISTLELIEKGENDIVEFKSSLRWNMEKQHRDKLIEFAVLKTLTSFMNTKGGTLLVGVTDEKEIIGIGQDRFDNSDKMILHLTRLVKEKISPIHIEFLKFEIEPIKNKHLLRIDCEAATSPAYLKEGNEEIFYVRTGPSTTNLKVSKVFDYVRRRFY